MSQRFEGHFSGFDQNDLYFQTWTPRKIRGVLVITHGLAEHSECYHPLAKVLGEDGWQVFAWDLRGHGRSEGKRGFAMSLANFTDDYALFLELVRHNGEARHNSEAQHHGAENLVLFGHSLGGLITLRHAQLKPTACAAMVLSSPALGLSLPVPKFKERLAHVASKWLPTLTMHNEIKYTDLTRDPEMIRSYQRDTLRHDKISPGIFLGMVDGFPRALAAAADLKMPVLMQLAGEDRLVSNEAAHAFFSQLTNKRNQVIVYPESYHEVYNDLERDKAVADLKKFVNPYLGA